MMAASGAQAHPSIGATGRKVGFPAASRRFDILATALAAWVVIGVFVDVNAHNHGQVDNTFFTPWHFLLYSGVLANGLMLGIVQFRNVGQGYAWSRALPAGYRLSFVGVLIFAAGGAFDFVWHSLFGFEANLEALLSPAHLILATGATLFMIGPLRSLWGRREAKSGWGDLFPAIASATITLSLLTLFTEFANVITQPDVFIMAERPSGNTYAWDVTGIVSVLIPAVLLTSTLLLLIRRWRLPVGTISFVLIVNGLLMFYLRMGYISELWPVLLAPVAAGIIGDVLLNRAKPSVHRVGALRLFAFVVPFSYFLTYFAILIGTAGIWWAIHMWLGAAFMGGIVGLGMSYLLAPPAVPGETHEPANT
jgi:hypothetical protein